MTEYGVCPECDNDLDKIADDEHNSTLWQCPLCSYEIERK